MNGLLSGTVDDPQGTNASRLADSVAFFGRTTLIRLVDHTHKAETPFHRKFDPGQTMSMLGVVELLQAT